MAEQNYTLACNVPDIQQVAKCFGNQCLGNAQYEAILIVLLNIILASYNATEVDTLEHLLADAKCFNCYSPPESKAAILAMLYTYARNLDLTLPSAGSLAEQAYCLSCTGVQRNGIILSLLCQIINYLNTSRQQN